ncbi:MAG: HPr kinase/phosphorylase, partial [Candidatus Dormibacteria bacterium]
REPDGGDSGQGRSLRPRPALRVTTASTSALLHAGLIARRRRDGCFGGVLLTGASGSGKSGLALQALAVGWRLVADDRTLVFVSAGRPFGRAPAALGGLIEARGLGVVRAPALAFAEIDLIVRCGPDPASPRVHEGETEQLLGLEVPVLSLSPASPGGRLATVALGFEHLGERRHRGYQACPLRQGG